VQHKNGASLTSFASLKPSANPPGRREKQKEAKPAIADFKLALSKFVPFA
jgi:hypothetical protein